MVRLQAVVGSGKVEWYQETAHSIRSDLDSGHSTV